MIIENKERRIRVRTNHEEIEKYRKIDKCLQLYREEIDKAHTLMVAGYKAEGIPMSGTLNTPDFWKPKSPALKAIIARYDRAVDAFKRVTLALGGAKMSNRLWHLKKAGALN